MKRKKNSLNKLFPSSLDPVKRLEYLSQKRMSHYNMGGSFKIVALPDTSQGWFWAPSKIGNKFGRPLRKKSRRGYKGLLPLNKTGHRRNLCKTTKAQRHKRH